MALPHHIHAASLRGFLRLCYLHPTDLSGRLGQTSMKRGELGVLEGLIIHIKPSFEPWEQFSLAPIGEESTGQVNYLLRYECSISRGSTERAKGRLQLSQAQVETLAAVWQNMKIGFIPKESDQGLDGTTTKVTVIQGMNKLEMEWWEDAPEPWKPVERIIEILREIVKDSGASS